MKRIRSFLIVLVVLAVMAACAAPATPLPQVPEVPQAGAEPVTINLSYFNYPPIVNYLVERFRVYQLENPNITINFEHSAPPVGEGGYEDKVTSSLATGTAPDVFNIFAAQAVKLINKNQLQPIDAEALKALGYTSLDEFKASRLPGVFDSWSDSKGTPYGIHWELSWLVLYCNDEHLKAGGVDPNTVKLQTWDDVLALGKKVIAGNPSFYLDDAGKFKTNFLKLPMYGDDGWAMQVLTTFLAQSGGSVLSADKNSVAIDGPAGVEALKWMIRLSRELGDPNVGPTTPAEIHTTWAAGNTTCDLGGPWMHSSFIVGMQSKLLGTGYHAYGMPMITAGKPGNVFWGWAWAVNPNSKVKTEAWKLIRYISDDPQGEAAALGIWLPYPGVEKGWALSAVPNNDMIIEAAKGGQPIFVTEHYAEIARILRGKIEVMAFENADIQSSLTAAAAEIKPLLDGK